MVSDLVSRRLQLGQHLSAHDPDLAGIVIVMIQFKIFFNIHWAFKEISRPLGFRDFFLWFLFRMYRDKFDH